MHRRCWCHAHLVFGVLSGACALRQPIAWLWVATSKAFSGIPQPPHVLPLWGEGVDLVAASCPPVELRRCPRHSQGAKHATERRHAEWTATAVHPWGATPLPVAQVSTWEVGVVRWPARLSSVSPKRGHAQLQWHHVSTGCFGIVRHGEKGLAQRPTQAPLWNGHSAQQRLEGTF